MVVCARAEGEYIEGWGVVYVYGVWRARVEGGVVDVVWMCD